MDEAAGAGRGREPLGKLAPQPDAAQPLVQHDDGRPGIGARTDHAVFEPHRAEIDKALIGEADHGRRLAARAGAPDSRHICATRTSLAKLCATVLPEASTSARASR